MARRKREPEAFDQISIRLPRPLLERADKLARDLAEHPAYAHERLTRGAVLRIAMSRGLVALEREAKRTE